MKSALVLAAAANALVAPSAPAASTVVRQGVIQTPPILTREDGLETRPMAADMPGIGLEFGGRETVWKSNPRRLTPWTRQYFSGSPNSLVDVYAGIDEIVDAVKNNAARTRRLTTARPSTCEDSVICGTAVFVCLVCGGEEPDDRFILRFHRRRS